MLKSTKYIALILVFAMTSFFSGKTKKQITYLNNTKLSLNKIKKNLLSMTQRQEAKAGVAENAFALVQGLYYIINGEPGHAADEGGILDFVERLFGTDAIGGVMISRGYTTCSAIPASGSDTFTGDEGSFTITYATPVKTFPSHFSHSSSYEKRLELARDGSDLMIVEFDCLDSGFQTGYVRFKSFEDEDHDGTDIFDDVTTSPDGTNDVKEIEISFQINESTNYVSVEGNVTLTTSASNDWNLAIQFDTADGEEFQIVAGRFVDDGSSNEKNGFMVNGNITDNLYYIKASDIAGDASDATDTVANWSVEYCLNNTTGTPAGTTVSSCTSAGLSSSEGRSLPDSNPFTVNNVSSMALPSL